MAGLESLGDGSPETPDAGAGGPGGWAADLLGRGAVEGWWGYRERTVKGTVTGGWCGARIVTVPW